MMTTLNWHSGGRWWQLWIDIQVVTKIPELCYSNKDRLVTCPCAFCSSDWLLTRLSWRLNWDWSSTLGHRTGSTVFSYSYSVSNGRLDVILESMSSIIIFRVLRRLLKLISAPESILVSDYTLYTFMENWLTNNDAIETPTGTHLGDCSNPENTNPQDVKVP